MTRERNRAIVQQNVTQVEQEIQEACDRSGRPRDSVQLIAVTKSVSNDIVQMLVDLGLTCFGESRPQELWKKSEALPSVHWHMIGHLQTNKVDKTIPLVELTHSVDRLRLLNALEALEHSTRILLEVNMSREVSKHGFAPEEMGELVPHLKTLKKVRVCGLMTMAAFAEDVEECRGTFRDLRELREELAPLLEPEHQLTELSMGMSNDFAIGIEEGATLIRVGSALFEGLD